MTAIVDSFFSHLVSHYFDDHAEFYQPLPVPDDFAHQVVNRPSGDLHLIGRAYQLQQFGEVRFVLMTSSKVDVLTLFFYPYAQWHLPLYSMQFVRLGGRPVIGVLDLPSLCGENEPAKNLMIKTSAMTGLAYDEDVPAWYVECRSGYDLLIRPQTDNDFILLGQAHHDILNGLVSLTKGASLLDPIQADAHKIAIKDYQVHHYQNSSGLPLMRNIFGEQWTQAFLGDWFYAEVLPS
ncbi:hypothetical protein FK216_11180 [Moraxellaceae bacterium AER2_44_116]|nr:hypothetical protein [Moraxellaceae bacterium]TQC96808.1 hypothetical protein FK216_11180 [Moraxellaceae bacterium AER2_44_116]